MKERRLVINTTKAESFITVNKQRLKNELNNGKGIVYVKDGTEFEIELFNPFIVRQLVKISVNNLDIGSGIIIKPGERIFLERYIETNKKFKFETYEVENTPEVLSAISKNGLVEVKFYNEIPTPNPWIRSDSSIMGSNFGGINTNILLLNNLNTPKANLNADVFNTNVSYSNNIETGRIGQGSTSSQNFIQVEGNFSLIPTHSVTWQLLPKSTEMITSEDIVVYCSNCGRKKKKKDNFCPKCGNKL